jgi:post-segregation antitoxin (ccd killing protein)
VTIEQAGNVTVEAEKTLTLKANKIELSADAQVKISGQAVDIN